MLADPYPYLATIPVLYCIHPNIPEGRLNTKNCQAVRGGLYVYTLVYQACPLPFANSTPFQLNGSNYTCEELGQPTNAASAQPSMHYAHTWFWKSKLMEWHHCMLRDSSYSKQILSITPSKLRLRGWQVHNAVPGCSTIARASFIEEDMSVHAHAWSQNIEDDCT